MQNITDLVRTHGGLLVGAAWFTTTPEQLAQPKARPQPKTLVVIRRTDGRDVRRSIRVHF